MKESSNEKRVTCIFGNFSIFNYQHAFLTVGKPPYRAYYGASYGGSLWIGEYSSFGVYLVFLCHICDCAGLYTDIYEKQKLRDN